MGTEREQHRQTVALEPIGSPAHRASLGPSAPLTRATGAGTPNGGRTLGNVPADPHIVTTVFAVGGGVKVADLETERELGAIALLFGPIIKFHYGSYPRLVRESFGPL